jgi:hypothetical protein
LTLGLSLNSFLKMARDYGELSTNFLIFLTPYSSCVLLWISRYLVKWFSLEYFVVFLIVYWRFKVSVIFYFRIIWLGSTEISDRRLDCWLDLTLDENSLSFIKPWWLKLAFLWFRYPSTVYLIIWAPKTFIYYLYFK